MTHTMHVYFPIVVEIKQSIFSYLTNIGLAKDEKQSLYLFLIKIIHR